MNTFANAVSNIAVPSAPMSTTANGAATYADSGNALTSLFFTIGSSRGRDITAQFVSALRTDPWKTITMLFWARDVRGGAGERETFRKLLQVLEQERPDLVTKVMYLVPEYGRWDDGYCFQSKAIQEAWFSYVDQVITQGERAQSILNNLDNLTEQECQHLLAELGA